MARKPTLPQTYTVEEAVSMLYSGCTDLGEELQEWADNMPENMQGSDKHSAVEEAADVLSNVDEPTIPDYGDANLTVQFKFGNTKYLSKTQRLDELNGFLGNIMEAFEIQLANFEEAQEADPEKTDESLETKISELEDLISDLEELSGELSSLDWS